MLKFFGMRPRLRHVRRAPARAFLNEPLESRILLCGLNHVELSDALRAVLGTGARSDGAVALVGDGPVAQGAGSQFPEIRWINRGSSTNDSDGFNSVFGANAALARNVVYTALFDWQRVFRDFNNGHNNLYEVALNMDSGGTSSGASAVITGVSSLVDGVPYAGAITIGRGGDSPSSMDGKGDGVGWFLDPTPSDSSEFAGDIVNPFAGDAQAGSPAAGLGDLYTVTLLEMTHLLGIASDPRLAWNTNNPYLYDTNLTDPFEGTNSAGGVGHLVGYRSPNLTMLFTTNNGGGPDTDGDGPDTGGSDKGVPIHTSPGSLQILEAGSWYGAEDAGNALYEGGRRYLVPNSLPIALKDIYGYDVIPAETFGTFHSRLDGDGTLVIRGGHDTSGRSHDVIDVYKTGNNIGVSVDLGNNDRGIGPTDPFLSEFPASLVKRVKIDPGQGIDHFNIFADIGVPVDITDSEAGGAAGTGTDDNQDTLYVWGTAPNASGATGDDLIEVSRTPTIPWRNEFKIGAMVLTADEGIDNVKIWGQTGNDRIVIDDPYNLQSLAVDAGDGDDVIDVQQNRRLITVQGGIGQDRLLVKNFDSVNFDGGPGDDRIEMKGVIFESYAVTDNTVVQSPGVSADTVTYTLTETVTITGSNREDTFAVNARNVKVLIDGLDGVDTFDITAGGTASRFSGGPGDDVFNVGFGTVGTTSLPFTVAGDAGSDRVTLDDHANAAATIWDIRSGEILYGGLLSLLMPSVESVIVLGGGGADSFNVQAAHIDSLRITGGAGRDVLVIDDRADVGKIQQAVVYGDQVVRVDFTPPDALHLTRTYTTFYGGVERLDFYLSPQCTTIDVRGTSAAIAGSDLTTVIGSAPPGPRGDTLTVGGADNSLSGILGPLRYESRTTNKNLVQILDGADSVARPITLDAVTPAGSPSPYARLTSLAPAVMTFRMDSFERLNAATGFNAAALRVFGTGNAGGTSAAVNAQPTVSVLGMSLTAGVAATNAANLVLRGNALGGVSTLSGGPNAVVDANTVAALEVRGFTGLSATANTVSGNVTVGAAGQPVTAADFNGNTVRGTMTVNRGSRVKLRNNSINRLVAAAGTVAAAGRVGVAADDPADIDAQANRFGSVSLEGPTTGTLSGNDIGWRDAAGPLNPVTLNLAATFAGAMTNNDVHNGVVGVNYAAPSPLVGNRVFGNTTGVVMTVNDVTGGLGFYAQSGLNDIYANTAGVNLTGRMRNQSIRDNVTGVVGSGVLGGDAFDLPNLIANNATGADFDGTIQFNRFASNGVGVLAHDRQVVVHNLIYRGTVAGVRTGGAADVRVVHNTFFNTAGNAVQVDGGSQRAELLNNVFQADGGYDVNVAADSRDGFFSDFNDLYSTGAGQIFRYGNRDYDDIVDLQQDLNRLDLHSIGTSRVSPAFPAPRFVDPAADDFRVAALTGGQRASSPTVDAGSAAIDFPAAPGSRNLLANASFETGTGSWSVNVGGATQSAGPAPVAFGGTKYFTPGAAAGFAEQTVSLTAAGFTAAQLDSQSLVALFGGRLRSAAGEFPADDGRLTLTFLDGSGNALGAALVLPAGNVDDRWELLGARLRVPAGARSARYRFDATRRAGTTNDAYLDNAFLDVRPGTTAPDLGAFGATATDLETAAAHIQVVFPDLYTDWERSTPHLIQWQTFGNNANSPVKIDLYKDPAGGGAAQLVKTLFASTPDTGRVAWIPEADLIAYGTAGLRIQVSLVSSPSVSDRSSEAFSVPEQGHALYVNDASTAGDEYATAPGDFRNTGRSPSSPKPSLAALLRDYALGAGDTVYVDTGVYVHDAAIVISANPAAGGDQGVTVVGPTDPARVAQITAPADEPVFDVNAANFVTLSNLSLVGGLYGVWVRNGSTRFAGSRLSTLGMTLDGVRLEANVSDSSLDRITAANSGRDGISVGGPGISLTNSTAHHNANAGVFYANAGPAALTRNESYANKYGLLVTNGSPGSTTVVGNLDPSLALGNRVHDNTAYGIFATGAVVVAGNTVSRTGGTGASGAGSGIYIASGGSATANVSYGNFYGVYSDRGPVTNNRVFNNADSGVLVTADVLVQGNVAYSNGVGIQANAFFTSPVILNNLVYANASRGVWLRGGGGATRVENNTVYQPAGDAVRVDPAADGRPATGVRLRNNVLFAGAGSAVSVDPAAESGFKSDYNLFFTTGSGKVGTWEGAAAAGLNDWRSAASSDANSLFANPAFVDADGADNTLGYSGGVDRGADDDFHEQSTAGSFHGGSLAPVLSAASGLPVFPAAAEAADAAVSPAVDRGDPTSPFAAEPLPSGAFINLGAFGNTAQASKSPTAYVRVLVPDGGDSILAGRPFDVVWRSHDTAGTVNIELLRGTSPQTAAVVQSIAAGAPNNGRYAWAVPAGLTPGGGYYLRVTRPGPPAVSDVSDSAFTVSGGALTFYVNDGVFAAGDWTTAAGNDANDGLSPSTPKRTVQSVLATYDLGPGDVIRLDDGTYALTNNITVTSNDSGVKIEGYHDAARPAGKAVLTRAAAAGSVVFDLQNADDVTLDYLTLAGGGATIGITAAAGADSDGVTVSHSDLSGFGDYAVFVHGTNDNWTIANNRVHDGGAGFWRTGVAFDSQGGAYAGTTVRDNVVYNNTRIGVSLDNAGAGTSVIGNEVYGGVIGITVVAAQGAAVTVAGNKVHDNGSVGILASGPTAAVTGNTAWNHSASGAEGIQTQNGATASGNVAYANDYGIFSNGGGAVSNNRAYGNAKAGIWAGGSNAIGNVVYNNLAGIEGEGSGLWANNLAYNNAARGLYVRGASQPQLLNNTVYQVTGDALTVESTHNNLQFQNIRVRNNVLWAQAGYAIVLGTDTAPGLQSDYNDLYATGTGKVGLWDNGARATLLAWQQATLGDANSIFADPRFVNAAGGDFHEQSTHGSFHGGSLAPVLNAGTGLPSPAPAVEANDAADSPAIDAGRPGDPAANEPAPNGGAVNLGAYGNTAQASKSATTYLQVTRPNGGEVWSTRQTFPVLWRGDNPGTGLVDIELLHRAAGGALTLETAVASGVANNGRYDWVIPQTVPAASDYVIRVTRRAGGGATAAADVSDAAFSIGAGTGVYYVNDGAFAAGDWTTAPGDDANSGLDPAHPKATVAGVLAAYALGAADVIRVDAGNYALSGNIVITPADSGVTIRGYFDPAFPDRKAVLDRGSRATNAYVFEMAGADDVTIDRLSMTGAYYAFIGNFNADSDRVALTNSEVYGSTWFGIYVGGQNDDWSFTGNRIYGNYVNLVTESAPRVRITNNLIYDATFGGGIQVRNGLGSTVSGNEIYGNAGDGVSGDAVTISNNLVHDNRGSGIIGFGGSLVTGNTVYGQLAQSLIGIQNRGGETRGNAVYGNTGGIFTDAGLTTGNRVFNNSAYGINASGSAAVRANTIYSNDSGISVFGSPTLSGNLVYANKSVGITMSSAGSALVEGNTVYQPAGDALRLSLDTNNTRLNNTRVRNNILWAAGAGGYAVNVTNDSDTGFESDFNDIYATGGAKAARWSTQEFATLREWTWEMGLDTHSVSLDPQFVDPDGADDVMGYRPASAGTPGDFGADDNFRLRPGSPAVDAADPASSSLSEPAPNGGRANLGNYGGTADATPSAAAQLVQVLSPNGGEKVQAGRPVTVNWVSSGLTQERVVGLLNVGGPVAAGARGDWGSADGLATTRVNPANLGGINATNIPNPAPLDVYRTATAADPGVGNFMGYRIPVANGSYTVRLHWNEGAFSTGQRLFDVKLQGAVVRSDFDVYAAAGGYFSATALGFPVTVSNGSILVELVNKTVNPAFLCGIEITAVNPGGVAAPAADVQLSLDGGSTWATVGSNQPMDLLGRGSFTFTPGVASENAKVRVVARDGTRPQDASDASFQIAPVGRDFYVNDGATAGDLVTTAPGANANHGKSPAKPMASIAAVLAMYDLEPGDVIHVDSGDYVLSHNTLLRPQDSGVTIRGAGAASSAPTARINRNNTSAIGVAFDFRGADDVTIDHLALTGAASAVVGYYGVDSDRVTVSNNDVFANNDYGVFLATDNDDWTIANNRVHDNAAGFGVGISVNGNFRNAVVRDNVVFNNPRYGIVVSGNVAGATVSGNEAYGNGTGIWTNVGSVLNNRAHHNTTGIAIDRNATLVSGNVAWSNVDGIYVNVVDSLPPTVVENNRVFNNSASGITGGANAIVRNNQAYSNRVGIVGPRTTSYGGGLLYGNLVYANTVYGVLFDGATGVRASNNTVYQPVGDAVRVQNSSNVSLYGNVLWVDAGADIYVADTAQTGFQSNSNVLYHGPAAQAATGSWGGVARTSLADWRTASGQDAGSAAGDPKFVDVDGADNVLGWNPSGPGGIGYDGGPDDDFYLAAGSPAIDRGSTWFGPTTDTEGSARSDDPGTPNAGGPDYAPTAAGASPYAPSGTLQARFNNSYFNYNLPFAFPFYGTTYPAGTRIAVSTEGYLHFEGPDFPSGSPNTRDEFLRNRRIAPMWDNINVGTFTNAAEGVYVDAAVAGQVKFTWVGVNESGGAPVNFSAVLFADGRVRFDYGGGNTGLTPTVGLSMGDGQHVVLVNGYDQAAILTNASPVNFGQVPGIVDAGAYEFRGSSNDTTPARLTATTPAAVGTAGAVPQGTRQIGLTFSEAINSIDARASANFRLVGAGPDGAFGTADDVPIELVPRYVAGSGQVTLELVNGFPAAGSYRLTVLGGAQTGVHDLSGLRFDGDGDGTPGGDYARTFTVTPDGAAPRVVGVWVGSTAWSPQFRAYLQSAGFGSASLGFALAGGPDQLKALPWFNLNRVSVRFSENVLVAADHLALAGVYSAGYDVAGFAYDPLTFTATWTLAGNLFADKLSLRLVAGAGGVTDGAGNRLDGEWSLGGSFPSGNAAAGGDFVYRFNVLPGDGNRDGRVNALDQWQMRSRLSTSVGSNGHGSAGYTVFYDATGDGKIGALDMVVLRNNYLRVLPPTEPLPAAVPASALLKDRLATPGASGLLG